MNFINISGFTEGVNYFKTASRKYQILLVNTNKNIVDYNIALENRLRGKFDRIPAFSISKTGDVYNYYDPFNFYSNVMKDEGVDKISIVIALENYGAITQSVDTGEFYDQYKNLITQKIIPHEQEWRNHFLWDKYTVVQTYALIDLVNYLLDNSQIDRKVVGTNVYMDNTLKYKGVVNRSNYHKVFLDPNPSLDLGLIKNEIEGYTKI